MLLPKTVCDKLVIKANAIDTKTPSTSWLAWFEQTSSWEEDWRLTKYNPMLMGWSRRLIKNYKVTQKIQRL